MNPFNIGNHHKSCVGEARQGHHTRAARAMVARFSTSVLARILLCSLLIWGNAQADATQNYRLSTVVDKLRWPWSVQQLPEGGFLISEREGRLIYIDSNGNRSELSGTPDTLFAGQGGYFDVLLHPEFSNNRLVYLSYAEGTESANHTAIFRARFVNGELVDGSTILRVTPDKTTPQHYGARMLFLPDGNLLLTTGDGFEHREEAQNPNSELGKVLVIDEQGGTLRGKQGSVYTSGHRNPQGLAFDAATETVYLHEHGPRGGDEINQLQKGTNYGWPAVTHGVDYSGAYVSPFKQAPGFQAPIWTWTPSIAPSGLAWYSGSAFPEWSNSLLVGALVNKEVRRIQLKNGKAVAEEVLFNELGERIRDVRVFGESIYILTDAESGQLIRVIPR